MGINQVIKITGAISLCFLLFCVPFCLTANAEPITPDTTVQTTSKEDQQSLEDNCPPSFSTIVALFSILKIMDNQFLNQTESDLFSLQDTHSKSQKIKTMSGMALGFQGFDPSKEGANLILKEEKGLHEDFNKDLNTLEEVDNRQSKIIASIMDLAIGHSQSPSKSTDLEASALQTLQRLVGMQEAERILSTIEAWNDSKTTGFHTKQINSNVESGTDNNNLVEVASDTQAVSGSIIPNTDAGGTKQVEVISDNNTGSNRDKTKQMGAISVSVKSDTNYPNQLTSHENASSLEPWTINQQDNYFEQICQAAIAQDPVIIKIKELLHQYNTKSELSQNSAKAVTTTLQVAGFVPTIVAPISGVANAIFTFATGGPEQEKLLKELYLSKCLESRLELIRYKARVILTTYLIAKTSNNSSLLAAVRGLLEQSCLDNNDYIAKANLTEFRSKIDTCLGINTQSMLTAK